MIELTLTHNRGRWMAKGRTLTASAPTIEGLDRKIRRALRESPAGKRRPQRGVMAFDRSAIPQWMRQYSQHYFNRIITVEKR